MKRSFLVLVIAIIAAGEHARATDCEIVVHSFRESDGADKPGVEITIRTSADGAVLSSQDADLKGLARFTGLSAGTTYYLHGVSFGSPDVHAEVNCPPTGSRVELAIIVYRRVPLIALIANPHEWDGRYVRVLGFVSLGTSSSRIYIHRNDWKHSLDDSGIGLSPSHRMIKYKNNLNHNYAYISGLFVPSDRYSSITQIRNVVNVGKNLGR